MSDRDDVTELLKSFKLPYDTLWELKQCFDKRPKTKVSELLSTEAKLAIQQTKEEFLIKRDEVIFKLDERDVKDKRKDGKSKKSEKKNKVKGEKVKKTSFSEAYDKSASGRMDGDITDESKAVEKDEPRKRSLSGTENVDVAMETVEIVDTTKIKSDKDEVAIAETAKLNSVEKCKVWMEVNRGDSDAEKNTTTEG